MRITITQLGLALFALFAIASGCAKKKATAGAPQGPTAVSVGAVSLRDVANDLRAVGSVVARRSVAVRAQVSGPLTRVAFQEGDHVREGDLLFAIDARPYRAALAEAEAALARDQARAQSAAADARRYADLVAKDYVTKQDADNVGAAAVAARATVRADSAAVESARLDVEYCAIRAPLAGRTGGLTMREGNLVRTAADQPLVTINQLSPIEVSFAVPDSRLAEVRRAQQRGVVEVAVSLPDDTTRVATGTLSFVDNAVDEATGTVRLKATFANADEALWPGQFVAVRLRLGVEQGAVTVPTGAVQTGQKGTFVFVLKEDQTVEMRPVEAGRRVDGRTVVRGSLADGEQVIIDGQLRLTTGAKVSVKPPVGANGAAASPNGSAAAPGNAAAGAK
ncbi:MAG: efflux RND transporter periplasmic adaptor subunit [Candidatus Eisenbacteria bacterium]